MASTPPPPILPPKPPPKPQTFDFNTHLLHLTAVSKPDLVLATFRRMQSSNVPPNHITFPLLLKAVSSTSTPPSPLHAAVLKSGLASDLHVANSLISAYAKTGLIDSADKVFDEMTHRDLVSWNVIVGAWAENGDGEGALGRFREGFGGEMDWFGAIAVVAACGLVGSGGMAKEAHCGVLKRGLEEDLMVVTAVVDMYFKCGEVLYAERVFGKMSRRNVVVWNVVVGGYVWNGFYEKAWECVGQMREDGVEVDVVTLINLAPSCVGLGVSSRGRAVHGVVVRKGLLPNLKLETALLDVYAKCGELRYAEVLFGRMVEKSLVSWNAMINGYVRNGMCVEAIELFLDLQEGCLEPDVFTISGVISAFSELMMLRNGRQIHGFAVKLGLGCNTEILNSVSYMYGKCGDLTSSRKVFDSIRHKDVVSWNTVIMAYAIHGQGEIALELFSEMEKHGFVPNYSTFVSILSACSISGLIDEGWKYFDSMQHKYHIEHGIEHYACIVDLLGREGNLEKAENFIKNMPLVPTARIWGSLLTASRKWKNIGSAELAARHIFELEHNNAGCYIVLANMYVDTGRWDDLERLQCLMKEIGLKKLTVRSTVEVGGQTCSFVNGDRSHPETNAIYNVIDVFSSRIGVADYISSKDMSLRDMLEKKGASPSRHCVRLAACFGLISSAVGKPVLVKKNVRVCDSCHHALKIISNVSGRKIIVGDSGIYHNFKNGRCSCGDYW